VGRSRFIGENASKSVETGAGQFFFAERGTLCGVVGFGLLYSTCTARRSQRSS
jgi:hypothetical protein